MDDEHLQVLLAEYASLRDEQLKRMDHRISLVVGSLTASAALLGVGLERESTELLLLIPLVAGLFGLLHIYHHVAIREIGEYIGRTLEVSMQSVAPDWTGWHMTRSRRRTRFKRLIGIWHLPIVLVTLVPSIVAMGLALPEMGGKAFSLLAFDVLWLGMFLALYLSEVLGAGPETSGITSTAASDSTDL